MGPAVHALIDVRKEQRHELLRPKIRGVFECAQQVDAGGMSGPERVHRPLGEGSRQRQGDFRLPLRAPRGHDDPRLSDGAV